MGPIWAHMGPYGPIRAHKGPHGPIWAPTRTGPQITITNNIKSMFGVILDQDGSKDRFLTDLGTSVRPILEWMMHIILSGEHHPG